MFVDFSPGRRKAQRIARARERTRQRRLNDPAAHVAPAASLPRLSRRLLAPAHLGGLASASPSALRAAGAFRSAPCAGHHPARSGLRAKIARGRWRPSRPPCRAHPPSATLPTAEPAPLWSDGREPCCARQASGHASTAARTTAVASLCAVAAGRRVRSLRSACGCAAGARPRLLTLDAGAPAAPGGCACPAARGARALAPGGACAARGHRLHPQRTPARTAGVCSTRGGSTNARRPFRLGEAALPVIPAPPLRADALRAPLAPTPCALHSAPRRYAEPSRRCAAFRAQAAARFARLLRGLAPRAVLALRLRHRRADARSHAATCLR